MDLFIRLILNNFYTKELLEFVSTYKGVLFLQELYCLLGVLLFCLGKYNNNIINIEEDNNSIPY